MRIENRVFTLLYNLNRFQQHRITKIIFEMPYTKIVVGNIKIN